jgi:hypothetical protein
MGSIENGVPDTNGLRETVEEANAFKRMGEDPTLGIDISVALTPCDLPSVPGLAEDISALAATAAAGDEGARLALLEKTRALERALETPRETMIKHCWGEVSYPA